MALAPGKQVRYDTLVIAQGFAEGLPAMGHASACRMAVDSQSPGYLVPLPFCVGCLATEAVCSVCECVCVRAYGWVGGCVAYGQTVWMDSDWVAS
jgi:hypothetical protein